MVVCTLFLAELLDRAKDAALNSFVFNFTDRSGNIFISIRCLVV